MQEAWAKTLVQPPQTAPRDVRAWLRGVLRFTAIDRARAAATRVGHERGAARQESVTGAEAPDVVVRAETISRVANAALDLDEPYRTTVLLRYIDELPLKDVAAKQGVPLETVRTRLRRALALLRTRLDERHGSRAAWVALLTGGEPERRRVPLAAPPRRVAAASLATAALVAVVAVAVVLAVSGDDREDARAAAVPDSSAPRGAKAARAAAPRPQRSRASDAVPGVEPPPVSGAADPLSSPPGLADADAIVVRAVDESGAAVSGVPVGLSDRAEWGRTDEHGAWRTRRPETPVFATANGENAVDGRWFLDARSPVAPHAAEARIVLVAASRVEGRVVAADGMALPLLEMEVLVRGERVCKTNSEDGGVFAARVPLAGHSVLALTGVRYTRAGGFGGSKATTTPDPSGAPLPNAWEKASSPVQVANPSPWDARAEDVSPGAADLVLVARPVATDGDLWVRVLDPAGDPLRGVRVAACSPGIWYRGSADPRTDDDGRVHLTGLDARGVRINPWTDAEGASDWIAPPSDPVVPRGQEVTLAFRAGKAVAGVVVDGVNPCAGLRVRVLGEGAAPLAEGGTGADGSFRLLVPAADPRALRVEVWADMPWRRVARQEDVAPGTSSLRLDVHAK